MIELLFWTAIGLLVYAYGGYPLLVRSPARRLLRRPRPAASPVGGTVVLIPVYNEQAVIEAKLANASAVAPADARIVVVSDGSTDRTDELAAGWAARDGRIRTLRVDARRGKNHALSVALERLRPAPEDVIIFTDANAMFAPDAIERLRRRLAEGVACVVGRLEFVDVVTGTARAEGMYWRYENALKRAEGEIGRLPFANGAIFAARARDVPPLPPDIGNDFWIPVLALGSGKPVVFEAAAVAREPAPEKGGEEFRRKVRMGNRQMRGVIRAWRQVDGWTRFQLVSHKLLRWLGIPMALIAVITGAMLWPAHAVYRIAVVGLAGAGALAAIGGCGRAFGVRVPVADLAAHFFLVHAAALVGVVEAVAGRRRTTWDLAESARRVTG